MRHWFAALLLTAAVYAPPAAPAKKTTRVRAKKKPRTDPLRVTPSETIENRVQREIENARGILAELEPDRVLDSPYLVQAVYYHDGFLQAFPTNKPDADPSRRIIGEIVRLLTPGLKARYIAALRDYCDLNAPREIPGPQFVIPVRFETPRRGRMRHTHQRAIDLFAAEGSAVKSASAGVVALAENSWQHGQPLSSSSQEGGNTVIVFDPETLRFYRYAHLDQVAVHTGDAVVAAQLIGTVGHTGINASRHGHGRHLHFEVNQFDGRNVVPFTYQQIRDLLKRAPIPQPAPVTRIPTDGTRAGALP